MNKHELFAFCKQLGLKRSRALTMAVHSQVTYTGAKGRLVIDYSPYGDNIWDANIHTDGGSLISIRSYEEIKHYFGKGV